MSRVIIAHV